jgi:hypothetical protein
VVGVVSVAAKLTRGGYVGVVPRRWEGADLYVRIVELYRSTYPQDNVTFYGIGNVIPAVDMVVFDSSCF